MWWLKHARHSAAAGVSRCICAGPRTTDNSQRQGQPGHTMVAVDAEGAGAHPAGSCPEGFKCHGLGFEDVGVPAHNRQDVVCEVLLCQLPAASIELVSNVGVCVIR